MAKVGRVVQAEADFRQSMALRMNKFASWRLAKLLGEERPCEGAFALEQLIDQKPERVGKWGHDKLAELFLEGQCATKRGAGVAKVGFGQDPIISTEATVTGVRGDFVIQTHAPFVVLSSAFAAAAKIDVAGPPVEHLVNGRVVRGVRIDLASVAIGAAVAERVPAVVVDEIPGEKAGIIGLSYLWRFQGSWEQDELVLRGQGRHARRDDGRRDSARQ